MHYCIGCLALPAIMHAHTHTGLRQRKSTCANCRPVSDSAMIRTTPSIAAPAVAILITGGTLDKVHDTFTESLGFPKTGTSQMLPLLKTGRCHYPRLERVFQKDSLDLEDSDREAILRAVLAAPEHHIVITHGTGTMELTARHLDGKTGDKTVVLTGAMRPFSLGKSDAGFNVGGALTAAQVLPSGVYGVMNGRVIAATDLKKDVRRGKFI